MITIYGASDDLIEVEGVIREEFPYNDANDTGDLVALSNGCIFRIRYDGCWRITPVVIQAGTLWEKTEAVSEDDDNYSDRVTIHGPVTWVVHGITYAS
jgi:hypothetical protein